jgi:hypothetical protein
MPSHTVLDISPAEEDYICDRPDLIDRLQDFSWFRNFLRAQFRLAYLPVELTPILSDYRICHIFEFWQDDIYRVSSREFNGGNLDHFKTFGHLGYWIRRVSPCIETARRQSSPKRGQLIFEGEYAEKYKSFLHMYGNEYVAFDTCFRACRFLHILSEKMDETISDFNLSEAYIRSACHMLKAKSVSPHALYLIFLSLFQR